MISYLVNVMKKFEFFRTDAGKLIKVQYYRKRYLRLANRIITTQLEIIQVCSLT